MPVLEDGLRVVGARRRRAEREEQENYDSADDEPRAEAEGPFMGPAPLPCGAM